MITVIVDFNARARHGLVKASPRHADGPVMVGDRVRAVDPDEKGMSFEATVRSIEDGRMYLDVDWEPASQSPRAVVEPLFRFPQRGVWITSLPETAASSWSSRGLPSSLTA
jgi:hypothetical protein